jgi:hypothetical protein
VLIHPLQNDDDSLSLSLCFSNVIGAYNGVLVRVEKSHIHWQLIFVPILCPHFITFYLQDEKTRTKDLHFSTDPTISHPEE